MSPTHPTASASLSDLAQQQLALQKIVGAQRDWFMTADGRSPLNLNHDEFEFSVEHNRLIFSCWTEAGASAWRLNDWKWCDDKLLLKVTRRMGAEAATIELIPQASARTIMASIAAARQERCEKLAELVAATLGEGVGDRVLGVEKSGKRYNSNQKSSRGRRRLAEQPKDVNFEIRTNQTPTPDPLHPHRTPHTFHPSVKIESATLSPGMRRDQPGRYARIILRLPHERTAVTGTVAQSDVRNVDALFSSTLLWFQRVL
jgi:hypothetical protein